MRHATWFDDLKTQGYTIIHNYLSKEQCKKAVIELKTAFESYPAFVHKKEDKRIFGIEQILPAARVGRKYGIAVTNGTAAIDAAVEALSIGDGDEVILPTFTIISCILQIKRSGATPVLVDSDPLTWNMDVSQIEMMI